MDNLAHTLAGLALAEAGFRRTTARATATLIIGANLPDVDALAHLGSGVDALALRRGWTHGVLAMLVLPVVLAMCVMGWEVLVRRRQKGDATSRAPIDRRWLLALAALGVWSHPLLDLLNTYGVRLLMPFSDRWFYGDALFIIDPWMWLVLGGGIMLARRQSSARPARVAIAVIAAYTLAMSAGSSVGVRLIERLAEDGGGAARIMAGPRPLTPFSRFVVRDLGDRYETGVLTFGSPPRYDDTSMVPSGRDTPIAQAAARTSDGAKFLSWSRFPRFVAEPEGDSVRVRIVDLRYSAEREGDWASVVVYVRERGG